MNKRVVLWTDLLEPLHCLGDLLYFDVALAPGLMMSAIDWFFFEQGGFPKNWAETVDLLEERQLIVQLGSRDVVALKGGSLPPEYAFDDKNYVRWLRGQYFRHEGLPDFLKRVTRPGFRVVPRFTAAQLGIRPTADASPPLVAIVVEHMPTITIETVDPQQLVDFLLDDETVRRKHHLFVWQNDMEQNIERGDFDIRHVPDQIESAISDYRAWMKKSDLLIREARREFVFTGLLSTLTLIGIPTALQKYFEFRRRTIDLADDQSAPGREVAHIVHAADTFGS